MNNISSVSNFFVAQEIAESVENTILELTEKIGADYLAEFYALGVEIGYWLGTAQASSPKVTKPDSTDTGSDSTTGNPLKEKIRDLMDELDELSNGTTTENETWRDEQAYNRGFDDGYSAADLDKAQKIR